MLHWTLKTTCKKEQCFSTKATCKKKWKEYYFCFLLFPERCPCILLCLVFLVFIKNWVYIILWTRCNVFIDRRHIYVYKFSSLNCFTTLLFFSLSHISLGTPGCFVRQTYSWWQIQWSWATGSRSTNKVSSGEILLLNTSNLVLSLSINQLLSIVVHYFQTTSWLFAWSIINFIFGTYRLS
jgi:hypothetical protein